MNGDDDDVKKCFIYSCGGKWCESRRERTFRRKLRPHCESGRVRSPHTPVVRKVCGMQLTLINLRSIGARFFPYLIEGGLKNAPTPSISAPMGRREKRKNVRKLVENDFETISAIFWLVLKNKVTRNKKGQIFENPDMPTETTHYPRNCDS